MTSIPFLETTDAKIAYLVDEKKYFSGDQFDDDVRKSLERLNFHFFLGYARNVDKLRKSGLTNADADPRHVFELVELDRQVSSLLFEFIHAAELNLRRLAVKHFCRNGTPTSYLDESRYLVSSQEFQPRDIVEGILKEVFRYGEDYTVKRLEEEADKRRIDKPRKVHNGNYDLCLDLAKDLPLWSVIDCFSLGQLGKFIMSCDGDLPHKQKTWLQVAEELGMKAGVFSAGIESLSVTRNLVCHHARLWMRPANNSPKKPRVFDKQLRGIDPKSQFFAFANIAHFQPDATAGREALARILDLTQQNELYFYGVTQTSHKPRN
ncbi:Abi family protein [Corynebacterium pilosum]|uniref:Phosphoribosylaminoimidazole synthetase n=1 Tax=Corynebacterium pilosum TaxID=35756 RepID=A0A376CLE6_9CORY|nr:Abi family protein [Corynebacterium pilosum]STC69270.1 phosphoribosylaminoimidazole synthetase [Corynebacterium pilosum]